MKGMSTAMDNGRKWVSNFVENLGTQKNNAEPAQVPRETRGNAGKAFQNSTNPAENVTKSRKNQGHWQEPGIL